MRQQLALCSRSPPSSVPPPAKTTPLTRSNSNRPSTNPSPDVTNASGRNRSRCPPRSITSKDERTRDFDTLTDAGLLVRAPEEKKRFLVGSKPVNLYDLSDRGHAAWTPDPNQPGYGNFCFRTLQRHRHRQRHAQRPLQSHAIHCQLTATRSKEFPAGPTLPNREDLPQDRR